MARPRLTIIRFFFVSLWVAFFLFLLTFHFQASAQSDSNYISVRNDTQYSTTTIAGIELNIRTLVFVCNPSLVSMIPTLLPGEEFRSSVLSSPSITVYNYVEVLPSNVIPSGETYSSTQLSFAQRVCNNEISGDFRIVPVNINEQVDVRVTGTPIVSEDNGLYYSEVTINNGSGELEVETIDSGSTTVQGITLSRFCINGEFFDGSAGDELPDAQFTVQIAEGREIIVCVESGIASVNLAPEQNGEVRFIRYTDQDFVSGIEYNVTLANINNPQNPEMTPTPQQPQPESQQQTNNPTSQNNQGSNQNNVPLTTGNSATAQSNITGFPIQSGVSLFRTGGTLSIVEMTTIFGFLIFFIGGIYFTLRA